LKYVYRNRRNLNSSRADMLANLVPSRYCKLHIPGADAGLAKVEVSSTKGSLENGDAVPRNCWKG
jgi:hypothetical protein